MSFIHAQKPNHKQLKGGGSVTVPGQPSRIGAHLPVWNLVFGLASGTLFGSLLTLGLNRDMERRRFWLQKFLNVSVGSSPAPSAKSTNCIKEYMPVKAMHLYKFTS